MPITSEILKSWAEGKMAPRAAKDRVKEPDAELGLEGAGPDVEDPTADDPMGEDPMGDELEGEDPMGDELEGEPSGEQNPLWAGGFDDGERSPEEAQELVTWLQDNEPELWEGYHALGVSLMDDEPEEIEAAKGQILSAGQMLDSEYPPVDEAQADKAASAIDQALVEMGDPEPDSPEWLVAVGIGIAMSRSQGGEEPLEGEEEPDAEPPPPNEQPPPAPAMEV